MKRITKLLNKNVPYVADDGYTYSATVAEHLMLFLCLAALVAIVLVPIFFGCSK